jgi:hypothetical protein
MIPKQPFAFHSGSWIRATTSDCRTIRTPNVCRTYGCSVTTNPYSWLPLQHIFPHIESSNKKNQNTSGGRYVHLPGRSVTRLTAYHISRHVASTFKSLATTTTHFDLKAFIKTDRAKIPGHDTAHDPVHCPYSGCRIVNKQFLYRASDRKSLDFYRSYFSRASIR